MQTLDINDPTWEVMNSYRETETTGGGERNRYIIYECWYSRRNGIILRLRPTSNTHFGNR